MATSDELCELLHDGQADPAIYRCRKCKKAFCLDHSSETNPTKFCVDCVKSTDIDVIEFPLQDKDGIRHEGRIIRPVGAAFIANNKLISELSDEELIDFVKEYRVKLRDAEMSKNFYMINVSMAEHEALEREVMKQKPSGEKYFPVIQTKPQVERRQRKPAASSTESLAAKLARAGVTPEMLQALIDKKKAAS